MGTDTDDFGRNRKSVVRTVLCAAGRTPSVRRGSAVARPAAQRTVRTTNAFAACFPHVRLHLGSALERCGAAFPMAIHRSIAPGAMTCSCGVLIALEH
jgi:hypothetical protein